MRIKSKKKLALLVGMALTVGSTLAVNPMDVYAASVTWDAENSQYKVTVDSKDTYTGADASEAVNAVIAGLKTDKELTIDFTESAWSSDFTKAEALVTALQTKAVTLQAGTKVDLTYADGGEYAFTNGADESKLTLGADNVLTINGNMDSVNIKVGSAKDAAIKVEADKIVNSITVNDGSAKELKLTGEGTVSNLEAQGNITVTASTDTKLTNIAVAEGKTLTTNSDIKAGSITGTGNVNATGALTVTNDISAASVTTTGALTATKVTAGTVKAEKVTAGTVKAEKVTADVKADSLELTGSGEVTVGGSDAKNWDVGTLKTKGDLTVSDATKLKANTIESTGALNISDTANTLSATNITSGGALTIANADNVAKGANITAKSDLTVTSGDLTAGSLSVNGALDAGENTITADSVAFGSSATIDGEKANIKANTVTIDTTKMDATMDATNIGKLKIEPKAEGGTVNVKVVTTNGALDEDTRKAIEDAAGGNKVIVNVTSAEADKAQAAADEAIAKADKALEQVNEFAAKDAAKIAQANPFITKLPSASDIATIANPSTAQLDAVKATATDLEKAISSLDTEISKAESSGNTTLKAELEVKKATLKSKLDNVSSAAGMQAKAAELTAAVQQAGKTAAAPGVASARTATVVTNVMTANVTGRTSELRGFASAVDEGRPAPDNVWFQYKHTNMDVDNGDVYGKSTVKTNNYQLGYDAKVGPNDYLGAYIGTTTGNVEFNAPAVTDRTDIDNAYDFGIYGTHMLPSDQYIDYMIHTGKFDSKYKGVTWGTKDTGAMIGYGAKIAQNDRLTWNPYIQLAYDKVSVDGYMAGPNYIASDDSNNWTAKLGINLLDVSGFYGGLAYSRGLSGSYNAYINGVPMPSQDNNANVLYMSLGYRANMSRNVFLDLSMEKTFADYNGWTAAGKVNFYF